MSDSLNIDTTNANMDGLDFQTSEGVDSILVLTPETNKIVINTSYGVVELPAKEGGYDVKDMQKMLWEACDIVGKCFPSEKIYYNGDDLK